MTQVPAAALARTCAASACARSSRSLSIVVAFLLFGLAGGDAVRASRAGVDVAGADRLLTMHKVSIIQLLPRSYQSRIAGRPRRRRGRRRRPGSAASTRTSATSFPALPGRPRGVSSRCTRSSSSRRSRSRPGSPTARACSSAARSPTASAGRSATACRCRSAIWRKQDGSRHLGRSTSAAIYDAAEGRRHAPDPLPLRLLRRGASSGQGPGRLVRRPDRRPEPRAGDRRGRSTRCSPTRRPRPRPSPRRRMAQSFVNQIGNIGAIIIGDRRGGVLHHAAGHRPTPWRSRCASAPTSSAC